MLKKILYICLRFLCLILFIFTMGYTGFLGHFEMKWSFLYYLVYIIPGLLLLPVIFKYFPHDWKVSKKIGIYFVSFYSVLCMCAGLTAWRDFELKEKQFSYQLGNNSGPLRILLKNAPAQALLKNILNILPYSTQYLVYVADESSRAFSIKNRVNDPVWVKKTCGIESQYECLKRIYVVTQENAPFNSTGNVLMVAVGATLINDLKKKAPDELKDRSLLESSVQLLEFSRLVLDSSGKYSKLENALPLPIVKINELSPDMKHELDKIHLDGSYKMLFGGVKKSQTNKILAELDDDVAEAYLLKKVEADIVQKFQKNMHEKLRSVKEKNLKKLKSKAIAKSLSKTEIENYRKRINQYQF